MPDVRHAVRNLQIRQGAASLERGRADVRHVGQKGYARYQLIGRGEDGGDFPCTHILRNRHARHVIAILERRGADGRHAGRDRHVRQGATA